jgi:hypothetical protein
VAVALADGRVRLNVRTIVQASPDELPEIDMHAL